jgi:DNA-binding NtrC family response regulator
MLSVLVIEDDARLARAIGRMLQGHVETCIETSAHAAIARIIETGETHERFDVVLCDSRMPGASGADVAQIARKHSPASLFVLMSGEDTLATADGNLVKPFGYDDFAVLVRTLRNRELQPCSSCG